MWGSDAKNVRGGMCNGVRQAVPKRVYHKFRIGCFEMIFADKYFASCQWGIPAQWHLSLDHVHLGITIFLLTGRKRPLYVLLGKKRYLRE